MGFFKDIQVQVPGTITKSMGFHDVIGVSWSKPTQIIQVTVGSWSDKERFNTQLTPEFTKSFTFTKSDNFEDVAKILELIINDPGSIFFGGTLE